MNHTNHVPEALGGLEHGARVHQGLVLAGLGVVVAFGEDAEHRLADGKVPGGRDRHDALFRVLEEVELAESGDVVDARVGAGVREHDQSLSHENSAAIGHRSQTPQLIYRYSSWQLTYCNH